MSAEIITLGGMDETDDKYMEFIDGLKNDAVRAVFIVEKKDGTVAVGTNSTDTRDIVYDIHRLQEFCRTMVNGVND